MAGLKAWDGSAFVDGEPRIWDGSGFVAPSSCHVWDGSEFVKVWPSFVRQRIVKSGSFAISSAGTRYVLPDWAQDATWPGQIVSNRLVVAGSGTASVSVSVTRNSTGSTTSVTLFVMVNGSQVDSFTVSSNSTRQWDGGPLAVADGDTIHLEVQRTSGSGMPSIVDGWIDLTPT